jgi:uncharacterized protein DUF5658
MKWLFPIFALLMGLDYAITSLALANGLAIEGNPWGAWMFAHDAAAYFKILVVLATLGVAWLLRNHRMMVRWLQVANVFMALVCINNVLAIS